MIYGLLILGALALPMGYLWIQASREERLLRRAGLLGGRRMPLPEFIRYLEVLFSGLGYQVERPPAGSDYGADLLLKDGTGRYTAVNARHFKEKIGPEVLAQIAAGAEYHDCEDTLVVSLIGFANKAIDQAEETGTILWETSDLADAAAKVRTRPSFQPREREQAQPASSAVAAAREIPLPPPPVAEAEEGPLGPPCPVCRKPMEPKVAAGREIWLCSRFPRCNGAELREPPPQ